MSTPFSGPTPEPTPTSKPTKPEAKQAKRGSSAGRTVRTALYVAIAVITTLFLVSNSQSVKVNYLFGSAETPLFLALLIALILGCLLTLGAVGIYKVSHRN